MSAEQRREQLLDAAAALIEEQGADALTMEGLAGRSLFAGPCPANRRSACA